MEDFSKRWIDDRLKPGYSERNNGYALVFHANPAPAAQQVRVLCGMSGALLDKAVFLTQPIQPAGCLTGGLTNDPDKGSWRS